MKNLRRTKNTKNAATRSGRNARFYQKLVEQASNLFAVISPDGSVRYSSPAMNEMLGFRPEERIGQNMFELVHPDDLGAAQETLGKLLRDPASSVVVETRVRTKSGTWRVLKARAFNHLHDLRIAGLLVEGIDLTPTKQLEKSLEESESKLAAIIATATDAIITLDAQQRIVLFNHAAEAMFRCRVEQVLGQPLDRFIPERFRRAHRAHVEAFGRTGHNKRRMGYELNLYGLRADGEEFPIEASISHAEIRGQQFFTVIVRDITVRKHTLAQLRKSEMLLAQAERVARLGSWEWDIETDVTTWSEEAYRIAGVSKESFDTRLDAFLTLVHPDDRELVRTARARARAGDSPYDVEYRILRPDGTERVVHSRAAITRTASGKPIRMIGVVQDITEGKRTQQHLKVQYEVAQILRKAANVEEALSQIMQSLCHILGWQIAEVWKLDAEREVLCYWQSYVASTLDVQDFLQVSLHTEFQKGVGVIGTIWELGQPGWIEDFLQSPIQYDSARKAIALALGMRASLGFPIFSNGALFAVMHFVSNHIAPPDATLLRVLVTLGNEIGQFIEHHRAKEHLRQSEEQHRMILANVGEIIYVTEMQGDPLRAQVQFVSPQVENIIGYHPEEFIQDRKLWARLIHPDDQPAVYADTLQILTHQETRTRQYRICHKFSREWHWIEDTVVPQCDAAGNVIRLFGVARDVTQRKLSEIALRESETRFRSVVASLDEGLFITDLADTVLFANERFVTMTGYMLEEIIGKKTSGILLPEEQWHIIQENTLRNPPGTGGRYSLLVRRKEESLFWIELNAAPYRNPNGEIVGIIGVFTDITERKRAEEMLTKLSSVVEQTADNVYITDRTGRIEYVNPAFVQLTGYTREEVLGRTPRILNSRLQDEDFFREFWETILSGRVFRGIAINRKKTGELWYEEKTVTPLKDAAGNITHFVSTGKDITERMHAEVQIRRKAQYLAALSHMGQAVLASLDLSVVLRQAVNETLPLLSGAEGISILLVEQNQVVFAEVGGIGASALRGRRMPITEGIAGLVIQSGDPVLISNENDENRAIYRGFENLTGYHVQSLLAVPLVLKNQVIGVIEAVHAEPDAFSQDDLQLLEGVARWTAIAIHNARQHDEIRTRLYESEGTARINRALNETLELKRILQLIVEAAQQIISHAEQTVIHLYDNESNTLEPMATTEHSGEMLPKLNLRPGEGIAGQVMQEGRTINVADVRVDPRYVSNGALADTLSLLVAPIQGAEQPFGTISVTSHQSAAFSDDDARMLANLGTHAAIAIKNARLYSDLQKALQQEQTTRAQLVQAAKLAGLGRMVATVAHELNNPLQSITNCLFLLQEDLGTETSSQPYLEIALSEIQRLSNLVTQLRAVYRPNQTTQMQVVDMGGLVEEVHAILTLHLKKNNVEWLAKYNLAPYPVLGNNDELKQVLLNICLNAMDAMQPEGGTLTVDIQLHREANQIGISFQDTGQGIREEDISTLFEPFYTTKESGLGLGLAISYDIIQKHSGSIQVASQVGQGSTFTIWLPLIPLNP
jgi:PAS domain S-box-containing protein